MVICRYFLNNTCRFGTKCNNEHVNVKLTLKTDAEGALKGNQWPLSSYGPFRDKPSIPNFIEDQSFEEARHLCYEAKASGNVQMVTSQFTQSVLDAKNKINMISNPTDDVVALVTNLYNSTCTNTPATNANANPFGMGSNSMSTASSIFGGNMGSGGGGNAGNTNLFGSSSSTSSSSNPFARNAAGFGTPAQSQSTNLFGSSAAPTNTMNLFGGTTAQPIGSSNLFGGSSFSNPNNTPFGSSNQSTSLFGGGATTTSFGQQNTNASPFGMSTSTNQTSGIFGSAQAQQSNAIFGGSATFGSQVKPGLFGQTNTSQAANAGNIFGQNNFGAPAQTNNLFGGSAQNQNQSVFGGQQTMQSQDNPFAAVAQSATTNIFGNTMQQQQQQASPFQSTTNSAFGNAAGATNAFGSSANMGQSIFGSNQMQNSNQMATAATPAAAPALTLQQQQQSIFGTSSFSSQPSAPSQTPFGGNIFQSAPEAPKTQAPSVFGGQAQPPNPFGAQPEQQLSKNLYTPMESLTPDEIQAFNSDSFDISKIPTKPPPMELCI